MNAAAYVWQRWRVEQVAGGRRDRRGRGKDRQVGRRAVGIASALRGRITLVGRQVARARAQIWRVWRDGKSHSAKKANEK